MFRSCHLFAFKVDTAGKVDLQRHRAVGGGSVGHTRQCDLPVDHGLRKVLITFATLNGTAN